MNIIKKIWWLNSGDNLSSILMEDSGFFLMEDSGKILTE